MELRHLAERILDTPTLEAKLWWPDDTEELTDAAPGDTGRAWRPPARDTSIQIAPKKARKGLPHPSALHDPAMRIRCLHIFANHELMAVELMAWALLAYPDAPPAFRRGLAWLIREEQRHTRHYIERIEALGGRFGDQPLNDHFWRIAPSLKTPLQWVCAMNLTFEQANLDHAPAFAAHLRAAGDEESAAILDQILEDEVKHVGFGVRWLRYFSGEEATSFEVFCKNLTDYHEPWRARGEVFNDAARAAAGMDSAFIEAMRSVSK